MYHNLVVKLLEGITDPATRIDVMATLGLFREAYVSGRLGDDGLRRYLRELIAEVLAIRNPDLSQDALREETERWVNLFANVFKIERLKQEAMAMHRQHE